EAEGKLASPFQALSDVWSGMVFELSKIRWGQSRLREYVLWALGPILALLLYQIFSRIRRRRADQRRGGSRMNLNWPGLDSEFYQLEKKLAQGGLPRHRSEP